MSNYSFSKYECYIKHNNRNPLGNLVLVKYYSQSFDGIKVTVADENKKKKKKLDSLLEKNNSIMFVFVHIRLVLYNLSTLFM